MEQLDLFTAAADADGRCTYTTGESFTGVGATLRANPPRRCDQPATHRAEWWRWGPHAPPQTYGITRPLCVRHANYYACAWIPDPRHYPELGHNPCASAIQPLNPPWSTP